MSLVRLEKCNSVGAEQMRSGEAELWARLTWFGQKIHAAVIRLSLEHLFWFSHCIVHILNNLPFRPRWKFRKIIVALTYYQTQRSSFLPLSHSLAVRTEWILLCRSLDRILTHLKIKICSRLSLSFSLCFSTNHNCTSFNQESRVEILYWKSHCVVIPSIQARTSHRLFGQPFQT